MANVYRFHQLGGPEVLQLDSIELPELSDHDVHIQIKSIGLNRADIMFRNNQYIQKAQMPSRVGYEAAGLVVGVGTSVTEFSIGDEVCILPPDDLGKYGTYADEMVIPESYLVLKPSHLSWEEASSVWMQYLTAWGGLIHAAKIQKDEFVLITAASSSVGIAAIQIAKQKGAIVIAATLGRDKKESLIAMGADHVIVTDEEDLLEELLKITGSKGLLAAFDAVGGSQVTHIAQAMKKFGRIIIHGALSSEETPFPLKLAIRKSLTIGGYLFAEILENPTLRQEAKSFIINGLNSGTLKPYIDAVFNFNQMQEAQVYLEKNRRLGKVVIKV